MKKTLATLVFLVLASFMVVPCAMAQQQKATKQMSLTVTAALAIATNPTLPPGYIGQPYSIQFTSTGGAPPITWSVASGSTLPGGLTLSTTGLLSGTLTTAGTFTFSVTATDSGTASASLQIKTSNVVASK